MRLASSLAHFIFHSPRKILITFGACVVLAVAFLISFLRFDTEILNLLPDHFESVQGLKILNQEFHQASELIVAIQSPDDPDAIEEFLEQYTSALVEETWVKRILYNSPLETASGQTTLPGLALPLLLNLPPEEFNQSLSMLNPELLEERIRELKAKVASGSPLATFEMKMDPLGLLASSFAALNIATNMENSEPLSSLDGTTRLVIIAVDLPEDTPAANARLVSQLETFNVAQLAKWEGPPLKIIFTGRPAFVAEISGTMQKDFRNTILASLISISLLFYIAYRRWNLLVGVFTVLIFSTLFTLAIGTFIFGQLNLITLGFCAVLFGLGTDMGMLLCSHYEKHRQEGHGMQEAIAHTLQHNGRSILFAAITTAIAFLSLLLSKSIGFSQLGVLIAAGILSCAILMPLLLFFFLKKPPVPKPDPIFQFITFFIKSNQRRPFARVGIFLLLFAIASLVIWLLPNPLRFDANPKSLEPTNSPAGQAYRAILDAMPYGPEPVIAIIQEPDPHVYEKTWKDFQKQLEPAKKSGLVTSAAIPSGFAIFPEHQKQNAESLKNHLGNLDISRFQAILLQQGFNPDSFTHTFQLLNKLNALPSIPDTGLTWDTTLPEDSSWWFVLHRYLGKEPGTAAAYIQLSTPPAELPSPSSFLTTEAPHSSMVSPESIEKVSPVLLTGWNYSMSDLLPWAHHELFLLTLVNVFIITFLLVIAFKNGKFLLIQTTSLFLSLLALMLTLKLLNIPLNLLNILGFPLVLGVGVDYGLHLLLAIRKRTSNAPAELATTLKPICMCAVTTAAGFGSLILANTPALKGLGILCSLGILWNFVFTLFFTLPAGLLACKKIASGSERTTG